MSGEELIHHICKLLKDDGVLLYDSNIIMRLSEMSQTELMKLCGNLNAK